MTALGTIAAEPFARRAAADGVPDPRPFRYRMVVLPVPVDCDSTRSVLRPLALNDCGEVTGLIVSDTGDADCVQRPFVWSLCGRFDLAAGVARNLAELASEPSWIGAGYGVNNAGVVVGTFGEDDFELEGEPWLWDLATYDQMSDLLGSGGSFALGSGDDGEARGVNDDAPAIVVGWTRSGSSSERGFRYRVGDSPSSIAQLPLFASDPGHLAFAVPTTASGPERIVGGSLGGVTGELFPCANLVPDEALVWEVASATTVDALVEEIAMPSNLLYWQGRALAANPQGQSAGWRRRNEDLASCVLRGVFWDDDETPIEVGLLSPIPSLSETEVRGMTGADSNGDGVLLVGADVSDIGGVLWWRNPATGDFEAELVGQPPWPIAFATLGAEAIDFFVEFNAVNSAGWIVGQGDFDGSPNFRAFVLIPDPCPADLNADGVVDGADLGLLLSAWGACGGPGYCAGDLNHDGVVDGADLGLLLAVWGACDFVEIVCGSTPCAEPQSLAAGQEAEPEGLEALLFAAGFSTTEVFLEWIESASGAQVQAIGTLLAELAAAQGGES